MKTPIRALAAILCACFVLMVPAFAATHQSTTLSAAVTATQQKVTVASATYVLSPSQAIAAGLGAPSGANYYLLYVDRELMKVNAVSGTTVTVQRGFGGTQPTAHASGAKVWTGPARYYAKVEPAPNTSCSNAAVLPLVAPSTGRVWDCGNDKWTTFDGSTFTVGADIVSAATIAPTNPVHVVSGANEIATITVPAAFPPEGGCITLLPSGAFTTANTGNIAANTTTAVVGEAIRACYNPGTSKWYMSY
jgi:hypothetical protein